MVETTKTRHQTMLRRSRTEDASFALPTASSQYAGGSSSSSALVVRSSSAAGPEWRKPGWRTPLTMCFAKSMTATLKTALEKRIEMSAGRGGAGTQMQLVPLPELKPLPKDSDICTAGAAAAGSRQTNGHVVVPVLFMVFESFSGKEFEKYDLELMGFAVDAEKRADESGGGKRCETRALYEQCFGKYESDALFNFPVEVYKVGLPFFLQFLQNPRIFSYAYGAAPRHQVIDPPPLDKTKSAGPGNEPGLALDDGDAAAMGEGETETALVAVEAGGEGGEVALMGEENAKKKESLFKRRLPKLTGARRSISANQHRNSLFYKLFVDHYHGRPVEHQGFFLVHLRSKVTSAHGAFLIRQE